MGQNRHPHGRLPRACQPLTAQSCDHTELCRVLGAARASPFWGRWGDSALRSSGECRMLREDGTRQRYLGSQTMDWTAPTFAEIKMDAEIGSYQADDDPRPIAEPLEDERSAE